MTDPSNTTAPEDAQKSSFLVSSSGVPRDGNGEGSSDPPPSRYAKGRQNNIARARLRPEDLLTDVLYVGVPVALLGTLIAVARLDGLRAEEVALGRWQNALSLLATLFPVLFASIIGRLAYQMARWRLEKGAPLGALEQLLGSRTLGGTLSTQVQLGTLNVLGVVLMLVWANSPLGAQAVLRSLDTRLEAEVDLRSTVYQDMTQRSRLTGVDELAPARWELIADPYFRYLQSLLSTLLWVPEGIRMDTMDVWGNVKIPFLDADTDADTDWQDVSWSADGDRFSALAGLPIAQVPVGNATLLVESTYVDLDCADFEHQAGRGGFIFVDWDWNITEGKAPGPPGSGNGTWQGIPIDRNFTRSDWRDAAWSVALDRFVDRQWLNVTDPTLQHVRGSPGLLAGETGIEAGPTRLFFQAEVQNDARTMAEVVQAYCGVKQKYVETRVECQRTAATETQNCTAVAQRPSRRQHAVEDITVLSFPEVFEHVAMRLPLASYPGSITALDRVLRHLWDPSDREAGRGEGRMFGEINGTQFSRRLAQVLNTYMILSNYDTPASADGTRLILPNTTAEAQVENLVLVYEPSKLWVSLGFLCSSVLLVGAVLGIVFTHLSRGPEVLGYASSSVRDSRLTEMDMPVELGGMNGMDISKKMKALRVRYGYSELTRQGQPVIGVGREQETGPL